MTTDTHQLKRQPDWLAHYPVSLFAIIMGLSGLTIAWMKSDLPDPLRVPVSQVLSIAVSVLFLVIAVFYLLKMIRHPDAVAGEFRHPVRLNFFPSASISLLLLSVVWHSAPGLSLVLWGTGASLQLALTLYVMSSWIHHSHYTMNHVNPAWFIPVVGNIIVPVSAAHLGFTETGWFFFSTGLVFWIVLMTIVLSRLFFYEPLPQRITPTLFILVAPPSVGFIAYISLTGGGLDIPARILFYTAVFLALLLSANALRFFRIPFFISSWAYSFPLAALTIAASLMAELSGKAELRVFALFLLLLLSVLVSALLVRTVKAVVRQELCQPE